MIPAFLGIVGTVALLIPIEYLAHRLAMHHECPAIPGVYDRHHTQHHKLGRTDINVDAEPWYYLLLGSPLLLAIALFGQWAALAASIATIVVYALLWTGVHRAIHGVGGSWARRLPFYAALQRHHEGHHARPGRNFGALFGPILDRPMGTWLRHRTPEDAR